MTDGVIVSPGGWSFPPDKKPGWPFDRYYPDNICAPILGYGGVDESNSERTDRMADRFGFAETSIGYVPITAVRGGIKYPSKGNSMPSLNHQLTALKNKQTNLAAEIANLERKIKVSRTAPPAKQYAWSIDVRFLPNGRLYQYLILRVNGMYYTTGTGDDGTFMTWGALLEWLDGVDFHSAMIPLRTDYEMECPLEGRRLQS